MFEILKNRVVRKIKVNSKESKFTNSHLKPFRVVREDGKIIHQFENLEDATEFSSRLNISYKENGINAISRVVN